MGPYAYQPLTGPKDIRLLEIALGDDDGPLQCQVYHASLDDPCLHYNALSYVWGEGERTHALKTPDGDIPGTASVQSALLNMPRLANPLKGVLRSTTDRHGQDVQSL